MSMTSFAETRMPPSIAIAPVATEPMPSAKEIFVSTTCLTVELWTIFCHSSIGSAPRGDEMAAYTLMASPLAGTCVIFTATCSLVMCEKTEDSPPAATWAMPSWMALLTALYVFGLAFNLG